MRKPRLVLPLALLTCLSSAAVASGPEPSADTPATDEELAQLVAGNTAFALTLYQRLAAAPGNLFMSPHSLSTALGMTFAGARGETAAQMAETLHFSLPEPRLHAAFQRLDAELARRGETAASDEEGQRFQLSVANALWRQQSFTFLDEFMRSVGERYGAEPRALDYSNDPEVARQVINQWVSDQTHGRIPELLPAGILTPLTRLVLTNAIYFNASWATPFQESATHDGTFRGPHGEVHARMMRGRVRAGYRLAGAGPTVVELPYLGGQVVMSFLMAPEGELAALEQGLTPESLAELFASLRHGEVDLTLPRFESGSAISLKDVLSALGMPNAFDSDTADFSGMTGRPDLVIDEVIHQANLRLDESGTEAAAATAVIMGLRGSAPREEPPRIVLDRPFLYLIRDSDTGAILFIGRLVQPS
jgi:serpin B